MALVEVEAGAADVDRAVAAAGRAFEESWWRHDPRRRGAVLRRFADLVEGASEQIADVESRDNGKALAEDVIATLHTCPITEVARLGRTLRAWRTQILASFDTDGVSNGGTEAINGLIELHRRIARGFRNRDNYRLRMLLIAGGLRT